MSKSFYPAANRTIQYWGGVFFGSTMNTNCICLHTTEGFTWPSYSGGAVAPHLTVLPNIAAKTVSVRQHYPADKSSRALVNLTGGVETNTLNVLQIELIGTCDYSKRSTWLGKTAGVDYIYWPDAPDWLLAAIAPIFKWLDAEWPDFKLVDATPRGWVKYPDSYGISARQRMTFAEWENAYGIFGHQHVPENAHGDPGNFPIARLVEIAKAGSTTPAPTPIPAPPVWGQPSTWRLGAVGPDALRLGERITAWNTALGLPTWTPDDNFSSTERNALQKLQVAWGFGNTAADLAPGGASDGYPGMVTFSKLDETPVKPASAPTPSTTVKVISASQNFAGNNARGIATASTRIPRYVTARKASPVHVINAQECTYASTVRSRLDSGLKPLGYGRNDGGKGRYTYTRGVKVIAHGLITTPSSTWYQRDDKQAAWVIYELDGAIGMDVSLHLESDPGATADIKRVEQAKYIATRALSIAKANGCPAKNVLITGDTNSEGMVVDALVALGWRNCAAGTSFLNTYTFMGWDGLSRKRFDYALVRADAAPAEVVSVSHDTSISDHAGLRIVRQLTK